MRTMVQCLPLFKLLGEVAAMFSLVAMAASLLNVAHSGCSLMRVTGKA